MIDKKWNKQIEDEIINDYISKNIYEFKQIEEKPLYSIDTPPPYINTPIHMGHAATFSIMDIIARYKRMSGFNVLFPLGLDRNGLPIEMEAEKIYGVSITTTPREQYLEACKKILDKSAGETQKTCKKLGISFNSWEPSEKIGALYQTDSPEYRAFTQTTFLKLYKKKLIYEDEKIANYCPGCKTTIADSEVEYKTIKSNFYTILFKTKETNEQIPIATTRPELIPSIGMIIYNPEDERWKHLENKTAISPIFNKEIKIKAHPMAKKEKGTGLVMMCSAGDYSDIRFFRENGLTPIISIDINGKMNKNAGVLEGLTVKEARKKIIEILNEQKLVTDQKTIDHDVPICERSKHEIEFISQKEFYLKQLDYIEDIKKISKQINFTNPSTRKILDDWLDAIAIDWPISRRRYYATEIPLWYCKKCGEIILGQENKYQKPWCEPPPITKCPKCGGTEFIGETRVFDTWFDSSNSAMFIHKPGSEFSKKHPVCSLRPQGKEIVRTWLYYTLLKTYLVNGTKAFDNVYIHHHILDGNGYKMSKSKGNVIDPLYILDKYGADSLRLWAVAEGNLDQKDFKCSEEKIASEQKTLQKIWSIAYFIYQFKINLNKQTKLTELDKWIRKETNGIIEDTQKCYDNYDFHTPIMKIKHFIWDTFSSHYLELAKNRCYNQNKQYSEEEQNGAIETLNYCFKNILYILHPITPLITQKILKENYNENTYDHTFPKPETYNTNITTEDIENINETIWKYKKEHQMSLKENINKVFLPNKYKEIKQDLIETHKINEIIFTDQNKIIIE
ncbi:MAG TPA: valine--tRNA ligase [Candidatus Diapherotrites archaeon]|nr:valine--tRNA ligase [Candidatus Diapherotrites archaeon]